MGSLTGKVTVITGAGTGIGRATALLFASEGAHVVGSIFSPDEQLPDPIIAVRADVTRDEDAALLTRTAVKRFGGLDILVNNAGISAYGLATDTSDETWDRVLDVNLKGVFLCSKYAIPEMLKRGKGSIVNTSSINGIRGNYGIVAYAASKGGVVALTMSMALDYATRNIRVNCVCPAAIETPMYEASLKHVSDPEEYRGKLIAKHPMGRLGKAEEVAAAILFLAGDAASYITGVSLPIDGGRSIR
jgi:NAD(P)-dependent dehydrogenase (short-subunit alcohol dehydrogenase family)